MPIVKTNYTAEIGKDYILITGSVPMSDLSDLVYFFESRLGEDCLLKKHPKNQDGFLIIKNNDKPEKE